MVDTLRSVFRLVFVLVFVVAACGGPRDPVALCREGAAAAVHDLAEGQALDSIAIAALDASGAEVCEGGDEFHAVLADCEDDEVVTQWKGWFIAYWAGEPTPSVGC